MTEGQEEECYAWRVECVATQPGEEEVDPKAQQLKIETKENQVKKK